MVMSQGTSTFLACFAGFWLVWAAVVMLCCLCSLLQRRLKRRQEEQLREQCLRNVEMERLSCSPAECPPPPPAPPPPAPRETPHFGPPRALSPLLPLQVPLSMPQANWVSMPGTDALVKPPCYEEAVLMEDPPPPYSEVLSDPRGGTYFKPAQPQATLLHPPRELPDPVPVFISKTSKAPPPVFPERGYSSLIRLPSSHRWDSLGHLLSNIDLNHNHLTPLGAGSMRAAAMVTMPRREPPRALQGLQGNIQGLQGGTQGQPEGPHGFRGGVHGLRGLGGSCGLPTACPLLGRSTAV
ncbi:proline-rich protein 7 [Antennarius striatus]|uniref:proline-rich protein 7 n=1 Tax=Antennarius striatus TaxID=241820 RepID=UPI0035ADC733